jgi:2-dehydropantoate 2-reductase
MRFVVYGAGAVGGVVAAQLAQKSQSVVLIARGAHYKALRDYGLRFESPDQTVQLDLPVFDHPSKIAWQHDDVVLLAMKTQDTFLALEDLALVAPPDIPVVCMQNGVANERMALRRFARVYGVFVYCAASHLAPGVVQGWFAPLRGILDVGCYPSGLDAFSGEIASVLQEVHFYSESRADIMRWKYRKLLMNLGNAVEALCGEAARRSPLVERARREGIECLTAAGISYASDTEDGVRRERELQIHGIDGQHRPGGSTWQSLARQTHSVEADYLNGEVVLLGRLHGINTPVNELLQRLMKQAAVAGNAPGTMGLEELDAEAHGKRSLRPRVSASKLAENPLK